MAKYLEKFGKILNIFLILTLFYNMPVKMYMSIQNINITPIILKSKINNINSHINNVNNIKQIYINLVKHMTNVGLTVTNKSLIAILNELIHLMFKQNMFS
jgi:hypothetical protein